MKDLSVIIVSYKGWNRLLKCLESLSAFRNNNLNLEVIIVDNSSDVAFRDIEKKFPGFRFIYNPVNGGFANGCNMGGKYAEGEFLLFLNPDTVVFETEIEKLLAAARKNPDYHIVSCRQFNENGRESHAWGQFPNIWNLTGFQRSMAKIFRVNKTDNSNSEILFPDWVSGSVIMIKKEIFQMIKGFDEDFWMYYEDVDLCKRINGSGGRMAFFRDITVEHNHGGSSRIDPRTYSITKTEVFISKHVYISKHTSGIGRICAQLFLVINNIVTGILVALPGAIFFFVPKVFKRTLAFFRLVTYYLRALYRLTWISPQSLNYRK
jgi:GT2 family glycosyltransferase